MDRELYLMKYEMFLADEIVQQDKMNRYIKECVLTESCSTGLGLNMNVLNESAVEKIKEAFTKIIQAIAKIWNRFLESANKLINTDKGYLNKYKDIILKKRLIDATYTMYDYQKGLPLLIGSTVPAFNYEAMKEYLHTTDVFEQKEFPAFYNAKIEFTDNVRSIFRNGKNAGSDKVEVKSAQINMTAVFDFCYNYKDLIKKIEKDIENVKTAGVNAIKIIDNLSKNQPEEIQQSTHTQKTEEPKEQVKNQDTNGKEVKTGEGVYYSQIHGGYINEDGLKRELSGQNNNSSSGNTNAQTSASNNPAKANQNISGTAAGTDDTRDSMQGGDPKIVGEHINVYMKVCGDFLGAKLSIAQEAYKEYMQLIRMHVQDNVGNKDAVDKPKENGQNYNNQDANNPPQNNQGNNNGGKAANEVKKGPIQKVGDAIGGAFSSVANKLTGN